jgi:organic radical activating enzyme
VNLIPINCEELKKGYDINLITGALSHCCKFKSIELNVSEFQQLGFEYFSKNSETRQARLELDQGIQTSRCQDCWEYENKGKNSWRLSTNNGFPHKVKLNLQISALCNQTCFYCSHTLSSSIAKYNKWVDHNSADIFTLEKKLTETIFNLEDIVKFVDSIEPEILVLGLGVTGGEPFIVDKFNESIEEIIKTFCGKYPNRVVELTISTNTNVKVDNLENFYEIINRLKTIYKLRLVIITSIENLEDRAEYVRGGLNWENFIANFKIHNKHSSFESHRIRMTINPFSIVNIVEFVKFFSAYNIQFDYNYPHQRFYRVNILDERFIPELVKLEEYIVSKKLKNFKWYNNLKENITNDKSNADLFRKAITNIDSIKNTNWRSIFPEYIEWFDNDPN